MEWEDGVGWVYPGPRALPAAGSGVVEGRLDVSVAGRLSASALPRWTESGVAAGEAYVAARAGGVDAWLGRRALALGPVPGGGAVLSDAVALDGVAVAVRRRGQRAGHGALGEGWTDRGVPLGHPLGGHGRETALAVRVAAPARGAFVTGRAYVRHRGVRAWALRSAG